MSGDLNSGVIAGEEKKGFAEEEAKGVEGVV
jgi:hypothetical protein